jgi:hypothetical protein
MDDFLDHLRRLGFDVDRKNETTWLCAHPDHPPMLLVQSDHGFLFRGWFAGLQTRVDETPLTVVNRVNRQAMVGRFFVDEDEDVVAEVWSPEWYDAQAFQMTLDLYFNDIALLSEEHRLAERSFDA